MIFKRLIRLRIALLIGALVCFSQPAFGDSYNYLITQWSDVNKTGDDDLYLCWAAASSNMLYYANWATASYSTAEAIFNNFKNYWTDNGSYIDYGVTWWLNGTSPTSTYGGATASGGGNYWPGVVATDVLSYVWYVGSGSSGGNAMADLAAHFGQAIGLSIYKVNGQGGHALTVWGYEYHLDGNNNIVYDSIWVTDSDDSYYGLVEISVILNELTGIWLLGDEYYGWYIGGETWLDTNQTLASVPIPSSLLLFAFGLLSMVGYKRFAKS